MSSFERKFEQAVKDGVFPGAILMAKDKTGKLNYAKAFGTRSIGQDAKPLDLNTPLFLASVTKLLTSIACMQIVERGVVSLDDDIGHLIPELADQPILHGFDPNNDQPILSERKNAIRLVHLLTHSAGTSYDMLIPILEKYRDRIGQPGDKATMTNKYVYPLLFEPGTYWNYGTGIDWAGKVLEKLTNQNLQQYMDENIFSPLGISRIKFTPFLTEEMKAETASIGLRIGDGTLVNLPESKNIDYGDTECFGGHGGYADLTDYFKILESLLLDDERLLTKESVKKMFSPRLTEQSRKGINEVFKKPEVVSFYVGSFPDTVTYDWGVGGLFVDGDDTSTQRKRGTMIWGGAPNLYWVYPPGDKIVEEMVNLFEKEMYDRANGAQDSKL